jgi:hypothetical protein
MAGAQGAAKTSGMNYLAGLVDPCSVKGHREPNDARTWAVIASQSRVVRVDNVSKVAPWWSDALCTTVTGGVESSRALYTDSDLHAVRLYAAIILNGITLAGITRADLAERTVALEMHKPETYRPQDEMTAVYDAIRPGILALILDDLAAVLADTTATPPEAAGFRMVNFAALLAKLDRAKGTQALEAYRQVMDRHQTDALEADGFAHAIARLIDRSGEWSGTVTELLDTLDPIRQGMHRDRSHSHADRWPENWQAAGVWLTRSEGLLANVGIKVTRTRTRKGRFVHLRRAESDTVTCSPQQHVTRDMLDLSRTEAPGAPTPEPGSKRDMLTGSGPNMSPNMSRLKPADSPTKQPGRDMCDMCDGPISVPGEEEGNSPDSPGMREPEKFGPATCHTCHGSELTPAQELSPAHDRAACPACGSDSVVIDGHGVCAGPDCFVTLTGRGGHCRTCPSPGPVHVTTGLCRVCAEAGRHWNPGDPGTCTECERYATTDHRGRCWWCARDELTRAAGDQAATEAKDRSTREWVTT